MLGKEIRGKMVPLVDELRKSGQHCFFWGLGEDDAAALMGNLTQQDAWTIIGYLVRKYDLDLDGVIINIVRKNKRLRKIWERSAKAMIGNEEVVN